MVSIRHCLASGYQRLRILHYQFLSTCSQVAGRPIIRQPVQLVGRGRIRFNGQVTLGYHPSPYFYSGYIYLEARGPDSTIQIEDGVYINNNSYLISDGAGIFIGRRTMLGTHCEIIDSDFHDLHPDRRMSGVPKTGKVEIGENVLIGSNVKILKGVRIGKNAIIANGAVVTRSIGENEIAFGNPARGGFGLAPEELVKVEKVLPELVVTARSEAVVADRLTAPRAEPVPAEALVGSRGESRAAETLVAERNETAGKESMKF